MWSCSESAPHRKTLAQNSFSFCGRACRRLAEFGLRGNFFLLWATHAFAADANFLGKNSCASSSCHGGAGLHQNQNIVWAQKDPHSRAPATLTTARSKRLAELLKISDATKDARCTSCHAPWQNLPAAALPAGATVVGEAVSCESCHGPAKDYLRSHTRPDLTRAEKLIDGLRDLTLVYNRANNCVACHQAVDPSLLEAGHPELLFELDGQTAAMPRHWREAEAYSHAEAWLAGQAAAVRELTAQLKEKPHERILQQWQSALWVINAALPQGSLARYGKNAAGSPPELEALHRAADQLAQNAASSIGEPAAVLRNLCNAEFNAESGAVLQAERLTTAIDRVLYSVGKRNAQTAAGVDELFKLIQSRPDFSAKEFGGALGKLKSALNP